MSEARRGWNRLKSAWVDYQEARRASKALDLLVRASIIHPATVDTFGRQCIEAFIARLPAAHEAARTNRVLKTDLKTAKAPNEKTE